MEDERTVPLKALQKAREHNKALREAINELRDERANVQAFLKQLGFSISAACASIFTREG